MPYKHKTTTDVTHAFLAPGPPYEERKIYHNSKEEDELRIDGIHRKVFQ